MELVSQQPLKLLFLVRAQASQNCGYRIMVFITSGCGPDNEGSIPSSHPTKGEL